MYKKIINMVKEKKNDEQKILIQNNEIILFKWQAKA